jgi:RNA polymerase sigma factor (sigma-70 family)
VEAIPIRPAGSLTRSAPAAEALSPEALCDRYAERVYRFAALVVPRAGDAEDVAQDALEHALGRIHQFDPQRGTVEAWLWKTVVHAAADAGRRHLRRRALWERVLLFGQSQPYLDVEDQAIGRVSDTELIAAVRSLSARDRSAIALRFGADLELSGVASALGISKGAAAAAISRALARLRSRLEERG